MKRFTLVCAVAVLSVVIATGCNKKDSAAPSGQAHPPVASMADAGAGLSGKVVETMDSAGYTYVSLDNGGKKIWVAIPQSKVKVGQTVTCQPGMEMKNFTSKTLNRTFDSIIFSGGLQ